MTTLGICGTGNIGKVHIENLLSLRGCRIAGLYDCSRDELARAAERFSLASYNSLEEMCADPNVDGVVIATPSDTHAALFEQALAAGKHVFVEKPLAGTLADGRRMVELASRSDRVAQAGFCERFNSQYLEAMRAVRSGSLGRVRAIHSSRVAPYASANPAWELGVLDTAVHNFDLILWLMGRAPVSVLARGVQVYQDNSIPHSVTTILTFDDGAMAVDHIAWLADEGHPLNQCARSRMLLQGDAGAFGIDLEERPSWLLRAGEYRQIDSVIIGAAEYAGCLKLQFEYFLRSVEEGAPVLAPLSDALETERVALAALESLRGGREVRLDDAD